MHQRRQEDSIESLHLILLEHYDFETEHPIRAAVTAGIRSSPVKLQQSPLDHISDSVLRCDWKIKMTMRLFRKSPGLAGTGCYTISSP